MSIWIQGRQEDDGRARYSVSVPYEAVIMLAMIVCGLWLHAIGTCPDVVFGVALGCLAVGLVLVTMAKMSLFRRGIWCSWGARLMTQPFRGCYRLGYALLAAGAVVILVRVAIAWSRFGLQSSV